jgi:Ca2+-binding RTX toxin-like protein
MAYAGNPPTSGNDTLDGGASFGAFDTLNGGDGTDTLLLSADYGAGILNAITNVEIVSVNVTTGLSVSWLANTGTTGIIMNGNSGADTLVGSLVADTITGGDGDDRLHGSQGNDSLSGGNGDDVVRGGKGNDTIDGGAGADTLFGGLGDDSVAGGDGNDLLNLTNDPAGANTLLGDAGNDTIWGGGGADTLSGGTGNDLLLGNGGNDSISSGAGNDSILGGAGNDSIDLSGADQATLYYNTATGLSEGSDTITGFTPGTDKISLLTFTETGNLSFDATTLNSKALTGDSLQTAINAAVAGQTANGNDRIVTLANGTSLTFKDTGALSGSDFVGFVAPPTIAVSAAGTSDASTANNTYTVTAGTYTYTISGFGSGDKIDFPDGIVDPTVNNSSFTDGSIDIQWAPPGSVVTITLTGLTSTQDTSLFSVSDVNTLFGAGTIF